MLPPYHLVINSRFEQINLSAYTLRNSKYHLMIDHAKLRLFMFILLMNKQEIMSASRSQRTFNSGNRLPRCAGVKGEAEGHVLQIKIQRCRLF